jgi:hypothetical protein
MDSRRSFSRSVSRTANGQAHSATWRRTCSTVVAA